MRPALRDFWVLCFLLVLPCASFAQPIRPLLTGLVYYVVEDLDNNRVVQRGTAGSQGLAFDQGKLAPDTRHQICILDAATLRVSRTTFTTPNAGQPFAVPEIVLPERAPPKIQNPKSKIGNSLSFVSHSALRNSSTLRSTAEDGHSAIGNAYLFHGRRYDPETGFYYFRNRYYDPQTGRFLQRDPVWDEQNVGGWYTFVGNGPVARRDPFGLDDAEVAEQKIQELAESVRRLGEQRKAIAGTISAKRSRTKAIEREIKYLDQKLDKTVVRNFDVLFGTRKYKERVEGEKRIEKLKGVKQELKSTIEDLEEGERRELNKRINALKDQIDSLQYEKLMCEIKKRAIDRDKEPPPEPEDFEGDPSYGLVIDPKKEVVPPPDQGSAQPAPPAKPAPPAPPAAQPPTAPPPQTSPVQEKIL